VRQGPQSRESRSRDCLTAESDRRVRSHRLASPESDLRLRHATPPGAKLRQHVQLIFLFASFIHLELATPRSLRSALFRTADTANSHSSVGNRLILLVCFSQDLWQWIVQSVRLQTAITDKRHPRSDAGPQNQESLNLQRSSDYRSEEKWFSQYPPGSSLRISF